MPGEKGALTTARRPPSAPFSPQARQQKLQAEVEARKAEEASGP